MEELGHSCIMKINFKKLFNIKQLSEAFGLLINRYCNTNIDGGLSDEIPHKLFTK